MPSNKTPVALVIAGLDPSGGAGLLLDARVMAEQGVYAAGVVTALTEQDTRGVYDVRPVDDVLVAHQIGRVASDLRVAAVKIGMLGSAKVARAVLSGLAGVRAPIVLDPILRSSSGMALLDDLTALDPLIARATLVTPNREEAEVLGGVEGLARRGARAVLWKGGHDGGETVIDRLVDEHGEVEFSRPRVPGGEDVHGTGCALASAIATQLARGAGLREACRLATNYVRAKIAAAQSLGRGARVIAF
jgi:hydroxymethylpyrimidine/phosphomethylpyrimidine kinase